MVEGGCPTTPVVGHSSGQPRQRVGHPNFADKFLQAGECPWRSVARHMTLMSQPHNNENCGSAHLVLACMEGEQLLQDSLLRLTGCSRVTGAWRHDRASDWGAVAALYSRMGSPFFFLPDIDVQFHFFHGIDELSLEEKKRRHFISEKKVGGPGDVVWIDIVWNGSVFWEVSWQQLGSRLLYRCQFGLSCGNVSIKHCVIMNSAYYYYYYFIYISGGVSTVSCTSNA